MEQCNAHIIRLSDQQRITLTDRLTTIGSSKRSKIRIIDEKLPLHCAYILFNQGNYLLHPVNSFTVTCNGRKTTEPYLLPNSAILEFENHTYLFESGDSFTNDENRNSSFHKLVKAINSFFRNLDPDSRFEMLNSISQTLRCDGARLVIENSDSGEFITIARFPQSCGLDRFSQRALFWAKQKKSTVLMNSSQWEDEKKSDGSLELNSVGSIICMPIVSENIIHGYLYLDRLNTSAPFNKDDWEICNALAPVFGDILALYERTIHQRQTIELLQNKDANGNVTVIFECEKIRKIIENASNYAKTDTTILIQGETGTGKEVLARFIHNASNRSKGPFLVVNCGAIPENLIESELFGHEKGAFTGATQRKAGLFESANSGTIFLDEIGELPINLQVKLLRVLQESEILPVGSSSVMKINVRVLAATNRNLLKETSNGTFRKDLYYRLNILKLELPSLRERGKDIILLADYFIGKYCSRYGYVPKQLTLNAQSLLLKHGWPGNIRELDNVLHKAVLSSKGILLKAEDFDIDKLTGETRNDNKIEIIPLKKARDNAEIKAITDALDYSKGNITVAANLLEIDRKWLTKLITEYGLKQKIT